MPAPSCTLLVSTYDWPAALELVLLSALAQRERPREVIVADDGSPDDTGALVRGLRRRFAQSGIALHHVWHEDRGFRLAEIRNRALAVARGDYVLMVDGDCVLHPGFVASHARFARPGTFVQGGRVLVGESRSRAALDRRDTRFSPLDRGLTNRYNALSCAWLSCAWLSRLVPSSQDPLRGTRGCNLAYWRDDAMRVNGFNERFVGWGREDSEFTARMLASGRRRRRLKFGGIVYHLWHAERPRAAMAANHRLYEEIVRTGARWCDDGLDRHVAAARERPPATATATAG